MPFQERLALLLTETETLRQRALDGEGRGGENNDRVRDAAMCDLMAEVLTLLGDVLNSAGGNAPARA